VDAKLNKYVADFFLRRTFALYTCYIQLFTSTHEAVKFILAQEGGGPVRLQQMDETVVDPSVFEDEEHLPPKQGGIPTKEPQGGHSSQYLSSQDPDDSPLH